jgi:hypothetical protein
MQTLFAVHHFPVKTLIPQPLLPMKLFQLDPEGAESLKQNHHTL